MAIPKVITIPIDDALEQLPGKTVEEKIETNKDKPSTDESADFLESLINQLNSDEAKLRAIEHAYHHSVPLKENHLHILSSHYYRRKEFLKAGKVAEKYHLQHALEIYLMAENCVCEAARIYESMGRLEDAINYYEKAGTKISLDYFFKAGELHKKLGNTSEAIIFFEKSKTEKGCYEAGKLYEQIKEYDKALASYSAANRKDEVDRLFNSREYKIDFMLKMEKTANYKTAYDFAKKLNDVNKMKLYKSLHKIIFKEDV